ncbi:Neuropeptide SIFamide receptor [Trichoplax sp. H2]|nr:Neuropeptide SIFamide receptor [Trichoplax sp. H2]|eukprot:RDD37409.1 Neuropeptide SIFamide receptor [Trichoplax sp. H2]
MQSSIFYYNRSFFKTSPVDSTYTMNEIPSQESQLIRTVIMSVSYLIVVLIAIPGNIFIIYAIVINRNTSMSSSTFRLILNSAIADLAFAVCALPCTYMEDTYDNWYLGEFMCLVMRSTAIILITASILSMTFIAIDRCITMIYSSSWLQSRCRLTNNALTIIYVIIIWLISIATAVPQYTIIEYRGLTSIGGPFCYFGLSNLRRFRYYFLLFPIICFLIPVIVMISCYAAIAYYLLRRNHQSSLGSQQKCNNNRIKYSNSALSANRSVSTSKKSKVHQRDINVIRMLIATVVTFLIFWLPYNIFVVYFNALPELIDQARFNNKYQFILIPVMKFLGCCHCCHNPIIYLIFNKNFQATFFKIRWINYMTRCCISARVCRSVNVLQPGTTTATTSNQKFNVTDDRDRRLTSMENIWRDICTSHRSEPKVSNAYASQYHQELRNQNGLKMLSSHGQMKYQVTEYNGMQDEELHGALLRDNLANSQDQTVV